MNRVYGVGVVHVRSSVQIQPVYRVQVPVRGRRGVVPGSLKRPMSKKKMTVQLEEPFVWPEEVEDFTPYVASELRFRRVVLTLRQVRTRDLQKDLEGKRDSTESGK